MTRYLLIDFGASRIKSAIVDLDTGIFSEVFSQSSVPAGPGPAGSFEVPVSALRDKFNSICAQYFKAGKVAPEGIVLCSEMHGFAVLNSQNIPRSGYVSWKDMRGTQPVKGIRTIDLISRGLGRRFRTITGMQFRAGLPYLNSLHMARLGTLKNGDRIVSLPEFLVSISGKGELLSHETMSAGLGFYDIYARKWSAPLLDYFFSETGVRPKLGEVSQSGVCGYLRLNGRDIPVFVGIGDHQCAVLGAGNNTKTLSVNIGTGSQVSILTTDRDIKINQQRPFFDGYRLSTITHIPAGRALNEYISFLSKVVDAFGGTRKDVWQMLSEIKREDVKKASLKFDLGIFPGAWGFKAGGGVFGIFEGTLTPKNYLASLVKSLATQYVCAIKQFAPFKQDRILLSGGVSHKLPILAELIYKDINVRTNLAVDMEETFAGLRAAACVFSGREKSFVDAVRCFSKKVRRN